MTSLFGPQNANGAIVLPSGVDTQRYADQSWVKDASAPGATDGTILDAAFFNRIIGNLEYICQAGGVTGPFGNVTLLAQGILGLLGQNAPGNLNTIAQLAEAINNDPSFYATVFAALNARLRFDSEQLLTIEQQEQAVFNLGLSTVATTGLFSDLAGRPIIGTGPNQVIQLNSAGKIPAVDGSLITGITVAGIAQPPQGQCRLTLSGANLLLSQFRGKYLTINGQLCTIPNAGITLAPTGLTVNTLYYIYAKATSGTVDALIPSTTGHSTDTTVGNEGVEIMTGDSTKTLVGMARIAPGIVWIDSATQRLVRSWFNRKAAVLNVVPNTNYGLNTPLVEIGGGTLRSQFLSWADESIVTTSSLSYSGSPADAIITLTLNLDGSTLMGGSQTNSDGSGHVLPIPVNGEVNSTTEGFHFVTVFGSANAGSHFLYSDGNIVTRVGT